MSGCVSVLYGSYDVTDGDMLLCPARAGAVRQVTFFPDFARFGMRNLEEEKQRANVPSSTVSPLQQYASALSSFYGARVPSGRTLLH